MPSFEPPTVTVEDRVAAVVHPDHVLAAATRSSGPGRPVLRASHATSTSSTQSSLGAEAAADVRRDDAHVAPARARGTARARRDPDAASASRGTTVSLPSSPDTAADERGSIGTGAIRWLTTVPETTTSQPSNRLLVELLGTLAHADVGAVLGEEQHLARERPARVGGCRQRVVVDEHELGRVGARRRGPR